MCYATDGAPCPPARFMESPMKYLLFPAGFLVGVAMFWGNAHLPTCPTEDSANCIWRADERGNGQGRSFIDYNGHSYFESK